jgi:hypothetical protein
VTDIPAESTLLPAPPPTPAVALPAPPALPEVPGAAPLSVPPAGTPPLVAAIAAATAMLTATAPTPITAGSDPRRIVTRLTVPQL